MKRKMTLAEILLLCVALPILLLVMAACVITLVVMAVNVFV
jgi:hypothetical protein